MAKKYKVAIKETPPRFPAVGKLCTMEIEGCLGCLECVKRDSCVYNVYGKRKFEPGLVMDTADSLCVNCLRCVQECKKNILSRAVNPRYRELGDDYWKPDLIAALWRQAETGKVPVSGAGYRGPFSGPGFDQIWTDMSEIVRPTRDGIHGREYISTSIELGRKPPQLDFDAAGALAADLPPFLELPIPIFFSVPTRGKLGESTRQIMAAAAAKLQTLALATRLESRGALRSYQANLMVHLQPGDDLAGLDYAPMVELDFSDDVVRELSVLKKLRPDLIVAVRLLLDERAAGRAAMLAAKEVEVIHLIADDRGNGFGARQQDFVGDLVREVHLRLVKDCRREELSLLVTGGIALAEHVAKVIVCGADGVGLDLALLAALECRLCKNCGPDTSCPVDLDQAPLAWGVQRITNLVGAWHSQLIEVMGAMGLREVRRLRGEVGRAMFFEDLERECFAPIFGERQSVSEMSEAASCAPLLAAPAPHHFPPAARLVAPVPSRYRNRLGKFKVVRSAACQACGKCATVCTYDVHHQAGKRMLAPHSFRCAGPEVCRDKGAYCVDTCPQHALRVGPDPLWETFGDPRWTADLIVGAWVQAETGFPPANGLEYRVGASGGGFDRIELVFPAQNPRPSWRPEEIDLSIPLNRRGDERPEVTIGFPVYGGGMSFGSISLNTIIARARAYEAMNSFTCTGEGGYPDALTEYDDHVITQVATGLFGVREETIQRVRIVEFKYAQGAKPGLGGHLLGDKVTPAVAKMREAVEGNALFSPFPFHSVYSVEDHKKHVDWIKAINPRALVSVKVSTPSDVDMVAVGSYYAGAHIIHLDGSYGGTGAAPDIAKKNIAMPIEYAIGKVHSFLQAEGIRDQMTLIVSGGLRSAWDVAKAIALGADGVVIGTAEMVALECVRCGNCESGRGCPRGIATTDPELSVLYDVEWASQRLINLFHSWCVQLQDILWRLGLASVRELVGRSDLLRHRDYISQSRPEKRRASNE